MSENNGRGLIGLPVQLEKGLVGITTVIAVIAFTWTVRGYVSDWEKQDERQQQLILRNQEVIKSNQEIIAQINKSLDTIGGNLGALNNHIMGALEDRWRGEDQREYSAVLEELNKTIGLKAPSIDSDLPGYKRRNAERPPANAYGSYGTGGKK